MLLLKSDVLKNKPSNWEVPEIWLGFSSVSPQNKGKRNSPYYSPDYFMYHCAQKLVIPSRPFPFSNEKLNFQDDWSVNYLLHSITKSDHCLFFFTTNNSC